MLGGPYLFSKIRSTCCNCCFTIYILKILGSDSASTTAIVMSKCIPTASRSATNLSGSANPEVYPKKHKNGCLKKTTHTPKKKGSKKPHSISKRAHQADGWNIQWRRSFSIVNEPLFHFPKNKPWHCKTKDAKLESKWNIPQKGNDTIWSAHFDGKRICCWLHKKWWRWLVNHFLLTERSLDVPL